MDLVTCAQKNPQAEAVYNSTLIYLDKHRTQDPFCTKTHTHTYTHRIEDTDKARSTIESEEMVLRDLKWLGLSWDEGDPGSPSHSRALVGKSHTAIKLMPR
jgi:hypothetical protein